MTNKQGRVSRKKRPKPDVAEEPPLVVNCLCPSCNASISPGQVVGEYLDRRCPACGKPIRSQDIDGFAKQTLEEIPPVRAQEHVSEQRVQKLRRWSDATDFILLRPLHILIGRKLDAALEDRATLRRRKRQLQKRLSSLAQMRYYLSEWYFRTGIPLKRTVVEPFELVPFYDEHDMWRLPRGKREISGMTAEFEVFHALLGRVSEPTSPLYRAQIVPNVYLPRPLDYARKKGSFWDQVDIVLLTRQAAFVIEVKRRYKDIVAPAPFEVIRSRFPDSMRGQSCGRPDPSVSQAEEEWATDETSALSQNSRHAVAFSDLATPYPFDKIYEQVVFVGTHSFASDTSEFVDNVNVSCLDDGASFLGPLEKVCAALPSFASQREIDDLGETIVQKYGDLNQKRALIHARRVSELSS